MRNIKFIIPIIMLLFFGRNIYLNKTQLMDSWMGGGMRMFAEIDKSLYRVVVITFTDSSGKSQSINLNKIEKFEKENMSLKVLPNDAKAKALVNKIKANPESFSALIDDKNSVALSVSIKVHKINFESVKNVVSLQEIYSYEKEPK